MEKEIEEFVDEKRKWSKKFHTTFKKKRPDKTQHFTVFLENPKIQALGGSGTSQGARRSGSGDH